MTCTSLTICEILAANVSSLVRLSSYRLIRISDLEETDVIKIFSLPWEKTWSYVDLNDGSWEIGLPLRDIDDFHSLVRTVSNAKIDLEYNPLFVPDYDVDYFKSFATAQGMHGYWLEGRVERIDGTPKLFYKALVCLQKWIAIGSPYPTTT